MIYYIVCLALSSYYFYQNKVLINPDKIFSYLVSVLRSCCFACNRLLCKDYESHVLALQLSAIRMGFVACAQVCFSYYQSHRGCY